jgi:hypothetical protein
MNVPNRGHLRLHFQEDSVTAFSPLLQKGFYVEIITGHLMHLLCRICGLDPAALNASIQTLFLNGRPVDDITTATVQDGDCLALSAAMPGLVGATMRSGGVLASFRHSISHRPADSRSSDCGGIISIKLFNLLIREIGPFFLQHGILVNSNDLQNLLMTFSDIAWKNCSRAELDSEQIDPDTLATRIWPQVPLLVLLEATFG